MRSSLTRTLVLVAALAAAGLGLYLWLSGALGKADTVVLVTVGGLRDDAVDRMPTLSAMASEGEAGSAWAAMPSPMASAAEVLTGRDPAANDAFFQDTTLLGPEAATLAERFSAAGYETAAFIGDGRLSVMTGLYRGFDQVTLPSSPFDQPIVPAERSRLRFPRSGYIEARGVSELAAAYLQLRYPRAKTFIWVHAGDPARAAEAAGTEEQEAEFYESSLVLVDEALAALRDALEKAGRADSATVLVASLHGVAFGEGGERRFGLFPGDESTRVPVVLLGGGGGTALPERLAGLPNLLLESRRLEGLGPGDGRPTWRGSWVGSRTYSWPPVVETLGEEGWRDALPEEVTNPTGFAGGFDPPSEEERAALLAAMQEASLLARSGELLPALDLLRRSADEHPEAGAPRSLFVDILVRSGLDTPESRRLRDAMLESFDALSRDHPYARLDYARALLTLKDDRAVDVALALAEREGMPRGYRLALANLLASAGALDSGVAIVQELTTEYDASVFPELWEWLGDKLSRSGNAFRAKQAYEKALGHPRTRSAAALAKMGDAHRSLGENEEALRYYGEAAQRDETYRYPHRQAGEIFAEEERFNEAAHAFSLSVVETGDALSDALARAELLEEQGLIRAAAAEVYEATQRAPDDLRLLIHLARLLVAAGDPARAEEFAQDALDLKPDAPAAMIQMARARAALSDPLAARAWLERAQPLVRPEGARAVREDPLFTGEGVDPGLAAFARAYAGGSGEAP